MELLLILLQLLIDFIPFYIVLVYTWSLCYLWMPIDLLLLEEGRHSLAASDVTSKIVMNKRATTKVDQRPTKARTEKTMVTDNVNDLGHPEQCSGEVESSKDSSTQCSENDNQDSQLVVTIQQLNKWRYLSVVSDDKQEQVSPPVAASKHLTPQVPPTTVREPEVAPPDTKTIDYNLSTIKETQNTYNSSRCQDGCDDDSEEDQEEERKVAASPGSCSSDVEEIKEVLILYGAQLCTSDTKLDQAGKEKETVYVMTQDNSFTTPVANMEGNQMCVDEVNNNAGPVSTEPSTILSTPASNGLVDTVNQTDQLTQEENSNGGRETLPDNMSDHTSPND